MSTRSSLIATIVCALAIGTAAAPAHAACKRMGFTVNDYGKEGPTRDAKNLLDKEIAKWAADNGVTKYSVGKKTVNCELFLDVLLFDEHTCTATASVCWGNEPKKSEKTAAKDDEADDSASEKEAAKAKDDSAEETKQAEAASEPEQSAAEEKSAAAEPETKEGADVETGALNEDSATEETAAKDSPTAIERAAAAAERAAEAAERAARAAEQAAAASRSAIAASKNE